jgi:tetratricopeptide (TPR) repeat protein
VLDCARAGLRDEALVLLDGDAGSHPLVQYYRNWLKGRPGIVRASSDYCFPSRLEEIAILEAAHPRDPKAPYYLGCLLYDKRRHEEAIRCWEKAARLDPSFSIVWRNLGIGYFNIRHQPRLARAAYDKACRANPQDARLLYERDQLWKRLGVLPAKRLAVLERHRDLVRQRDDLTVELASLYNQTGQPEKALKLLETRQFQPWEGGEGQALGQYVRTQLALGRRVLAAGEADQARRHFESARCATPNLGEAKHLLANQSDIHYWLGVACEACGDRKAARLWWTKAAHFRGDFQAMQVRAFSELTYYSAMALKRLGRKADAGRLLRDLSVYATDLKSKAVKIDYFATSLPTMLLFDDDLKQRQDITATVLQALAHLGLGHRAVATKLIDKVLLADPAHAIACDLCRDVRPLGDRNPG